MTKETKVYATGLNGQRRLVHILYKRPGNPRYTIARYDHKGNCTGLERGGKTLNDALAVSESILRCQNYKEISTHCAMTHPKETPRSCGNARRDN